MCVIYSCPRGWVLLMHRFPREQRKKQISKKFKIKFVQKVRFSKCVSKLITYRNVKYILSYLLTLLVPKKCFTGKNLTAFIE
jgi:hypothetical protein